MISSWDYVSSARARLRSYMDPQARPRSPLRILSLHDQLGGKGWKAWIKEKGREGIGLLNGNGHTDIQVVNVFPGWAARRYAREGDTQFPPQFDLEVFVSGFACSRRDPEHATRSQRTFVRLAKSFARLPKIVESTANASPFESTLAHLTPQTEERLALIPQNDVESVEIEDLDRELNLAKQDDSEGGYLSEISPYYDDLQRETSNDKEIPVAQLEILRRLHDNLEKRISCLWYSALPNRTVRLHFLISPHKDVASHENSESSSGMGEFSLDPEDGFIAVQDVTTGADGSFQARLRVKWEDLCQHPRALHIAFAETIDDDDLLVVAKLLPHFNQSSQGPAITQHPPVSANSLATITRIPITHSPIRVISDIDDTVKLSGILSGARAVFQNVFVKDLRDNVIPGMGEWYMKMFSQGVRFHYVSNGPFAILPILNEFFQVSQLPLGSLKLRSYAGRSIFHDLLSAPATRKRGGVLEVLDAFPDSLFFLIGDTGQQDLELYTEIARERPDQILGVFLRDARPDSQNAPEPLNDPTGLNGSDAENVTDRPSIARTGSFASLLRRFPSYRASNSVWRTASLEGIATPNGIVHSSTRLTVDNVLTTFESHPHLKEESRASYFGIGPLTSQPDEGHQHEFNSSSRSSSSSPTSVGHSTNHLSQVQTTVDRVFVTEPPKPTPLPSITNPQFSRSAASSPALKRALSGSSMSSLFENGDGQNTGRTPKGTLRDQLQKRVYRARLLMPEHIVLRIFGDPTECVEVQEILRP